MLNPSGGGKLSISTIHNDNDPAAMELSESGGSGIYYKQSDEFSAGTETYTNIPSWIFSMYATGTTDC